MRVGAKCDMNVEEVVYIKFKIWGKKVMDKKEGYGYISRDPS